MGELPMRKIPSALQEQFVVSLRHHAIPQIAMGSALECDESDTSSTIDHGHGCFRIARAGSEPQRRGFVNSAQIVSGQFNLEHQ